MVKLIYRTDNLHTQLFHDAAGLFQVHERPFNSPEKKRKLNYDAFLELKETEAHSTGGKFDCVSITTR
jgi:hypothetical protein